MTAFRCILAVDDGVRAIAFPADDRILVTDDGRVFKRINITHPERAQWYQFKSQIDRDGYCYLRISGQKWMLHRLIYSLFVAPLIDGLVVCHRDGDVKNNRAENLLQDTQAVNISHKREHGTWQSGERHSNSIYDQATVDAVKKRLASLPRSKTGRIQRGHSLALAAEMKVSKHLVYSLVQGGWQT